MLEIELTEQLAREVIRCAAGHRDGRVVLGRRSIGWRVDRARRGVDEATCPGREPAALAKIKGRERIGLDASFGNGRIRVIRRNVGRKVTDEFSAIDRTRDCVAVTHVGVNNAVANARRARRAAAVRSPSRRRRSGPRARRRRGDRGIPTRR